MLNEDYANNSNPKLNNYQKSKKKYPNENFFNKACLLVVVKKNCFRNQMRAIDTY